MEFNYLKNIIESSKISNSNLNYSTTGDGRIDSAESEIIVIDHLKALFTDTPIKIIEAPK